MLQQAETEDPEGAIVLETAPARWSRSAVASFTLALIPPVALIGSLWSLAAFSRTERLGLRGGSLAVAGTVIGALSSALTAVLIIAGMALAAPAASLISDVQRFAPLITGTSTPSGLDRVDVGAGGSALEGSDPVPAAPPGPPEARPDGAESLDKLEQALPEGVDVDQMRAVVEEAIRNGATIEDLKRYLPAGVSVDDAIALLAKK